MPLSRQLTKLLPLAVVVSVAAIVAMAARSPLPSAEKLPEVGVEFSDLKPAVDRVNGPLSQELAVLRGRIEKLQHRVEELARRKGTPRS